MKASWTLLKYQSVIQILKQDKFFPFPEKESTSSSVPEKRQQNLKSSFGIITLVIEYIRI